MSQVGFYFEFCCVAKQQRTNSSGPFRAYLVRLSLQPGVSLTRVVVLLTCEYAFQRLVLRTVNHSAPWISSKLHHSSELQNVVKSRTWIQHGVLISLSKDNLAYCVSTQHKLWLSSAPVRIRTSCFWIWRSRFAPWLWRSFSLLLFHCSLSPKSSIQPLKKMKVVLTALNIKSVERPAQKPVATSMTKRWCVWRCVSKAVSALGVWSLMNKHKNVFVRLKNAVTLPTLFLRPKTFPTFLEKPKCKT